MHVCQVSWAQVKARNLVRSVALVIGCTIVGAAPPPGEPDSPLSTAALTDQTVIRSRAVSADLDPLAVAGSNTRIPPGARYHPERVLVRFKPGVARAKRQAAHATARARKTLREYRVVSGLQLVQVPHGQVAEAVAAYRDNPNVLYAEPDCVICADDVPNDPYFDQLWGLHNTGQPIDGDTGTPGADIGVLEAWEHWTGDPDFRIAVIDGGVNYEHPDLAANIWTNPGEIPDNGIDDDGNGWVDDVHGYDVINDDADPMDDSGHGSHVAGTIGAIANNNEGVVGVNWQCKIVPLKSLNYG